MKKRVKIYVLIGFFIFSFLVIFPSEILGFFFKLNDFFYAAIVSLLIGGENYITIYSPQNTTYNFSLGENYTLELNVSSDFDAVNWYYSLIDLKHNETIYDLIPFSPNTTFDAVRWGNQLIVYADTPEGSSANASVIFSVYVPNSAPILGNISDNFYVCEGDTFSSFFNITDIDEQIIYADISPKNPFYISPIAFFPLAYQTTYASEIFSGILEKSNVGLYSQTISVNDGEYSDLKNFNITVIEINNAPVIDNIGVQTVWTHGDNSTFYFPVIVNDVEDGNQNSGNLTFNISFSLEENLFNISSFGIMNFTPNVSQIGVYNISVCVKDIGLSYTPENISLCGQDGTSITSCNNFSLTITNQNRYPYITSYYPLELNNTFSGTDLIYFNISMYDADQTIPDAYWYVDNSLVQYSSGNLFDSLYYSFGCGISGNHSVKVEITDGLLNDSIEWNISVSYVGCPVPELTSGGGGGGGGISMGCFEKWATEEWQICQNAQKSFSLGLLSSQDFRFIQEECSKNSFENVYCGFQIRNVIDLNNCSNLISRTLKPSEIQVCYFTENPSCNDGIKNCHDNRCETLIDCGGPCPPCPTCSDGIKNQGEEGIDCGGPCPMLCPIKVPFFQSVFFKLLLLLAFSLVIILIVLFILLKLRKISEYKERLKFQKKDQ
jgi:hypothetical protein